MKIKTAANTLLILMALFFSSSCEDTNVLMMTEAGLDAVSAVTLSDEDVRRIAQQAAASSDEKNTVAGSSSSYEKRLRKLTRGHERRDGRHFNYKVYLTQDINAFAMADGTIRVYSGLMDLMNDEELLFVIGHEMGHVVKDHSRKKVVLAYASSAVRKGLASQENEIGQIARSVLGDLAERLANAQFSQHEEREADTYGALFLVEEGGAIDSAVSALHKLEKLARQHTFLSSHPDPAKRAERIASGQYLKDDDEQTSLIDKLIGLVMKLIGLVLSLIKFLFSLFF